MRMSRLTCLACQAGFTDAELHRVHFKGDWHRYNLKRKVANLPTVTAEIFQTRKEAHETQTKIDNGEVKEDGTFCIACRKSFKNDAGYNNHLNSKKHKEMLLKVNTADLNNIKEKAKAALEKVIVEEEEDDDEDMEVEEVDSDEWEEFEDDPIPVTDCLFCMHHSANLDNNMRHMSESHSFFIPDPEFLVNLEGLIEYLGAKVGQGHMCLWCCEKGKAFKTVESVQKHMIDKGHCKLRHEGHTLIEYGEYYDYSTSYPDGDETNKDEEAHLDNIDDSGLLLSLPSGATVGHRSLYRYYKQSMNPNRALVAVDKSASGRLVSTYRAMGWTGSSKVEVAKKVRDIKYLHRMQNKSQMRLGWKANKLQTYFRDRNGMC